MKPRAKPCLPTEKHNRGDDERRNADDAETQHQLNRQKDRCDEGMYYQSACHTNMITVETRPLHVLTLPQVGFVSDAVVVNS